MPQSDIETSDAAGDDAETLNLAEQAPLETSGANEAAPTDPAPTPPGDASTPESAPEAANPEASDPAPTPVEESPESEVSAPEPPESPAPDAPAKESPAKESPATESTAPESPAKESPATESPAPESPAPETPPSKAAEPQAEQLAPEPAKTADDNPEGAATPEFVPPIAAHEPVMMQILGGIVTAVSNKEVDLTLDDGRAAVIHRENFDLAGTDPTTVLQVGDGSEGAVLSREDPKNRVVLSRKWVLRDRAWKKAAACAEDNSLMSVRVTAVSAKGAVVDVMGLPGFVPLSHLQVEKGKPSEELVGQMVELRVIAADRQKAKLLLSRRAQLLKEQRKAEVEALQALSVGSVHTGKVVDLTKFGAFVEVNGVRGLLHVSEMSWERVSSPKGIVAVGDEIEVKVIELKIKKRRVSFSLKELIEDPLAGVEVGGIYSGKVKRLVDYGVFVDIGPTEGMVHLSELAEYRPSHPSEIVLRGDEVQVKVLKVNRQKRRVELSMRQALYPS